jgi:hypothetical protein
MPFPEAPPPDPPDPNDSVPPMARSLHPPASRFQQLFASPVWQRTALFFRGVYELIRHLTKRGREVWRSERVVDVRAQVKSRPFPYLIGAATAFTFIVMLASAASSRLDPEAQTALGAVSQDAAGVAKLNAALAALPRCK